MQNMYHSGNRDDAKIKSWVFFFPRAIIAHTSNAREGRMEDINYSKFMQLDETEIKEIIFDRLRNNFHLKEEVECTHFTGKKLRIDAVLKEKKTGEYFGLEIKACRENGSSKHISKAIKQCIDYSQSLFGGKERLKILLFLPLLDLYAAAKNIRIGGRDDFPQVNPFNVVDAILGKFGV